MLDRISSWSRRRKILAGVGVGFLILVILGMITSALEPEESRQARLAVTATAEAQKAIADATAEVVNAEATRVAGMPITVCDQDCRNKFLTTANARCPRHIERLLKYDYEWTDGFAKLKFDRAIDLGDGLVLYFGDKLRAQNGFGAWQNNVGYACSIDVNTKEVFEVSIR